jgi:hypothetical protein
VFKRNGSTGQQWRIKYVDEVGEDKTTHNFGFRVGKAFYIQSRMPMERVIGGTSYVYLQNMNKAKTQQWKFD